MYRAVIQETEIGFALYLNIYFQACDILILAFAESFVSLYSQFNEKKRNRTYSTK